MRWKNIVSKLNRSWTKTLWPAKKWLLHICCCGYAGVFPQTPGFCRLGCLFADALAVNVGLSSKLVDHRLSARFVVLPCAGSGLATFFLKTKNTRVVLALFFADVCGLRCLFADAWAVAFACHILGRQDLSSFLHRSRPCHLLPEDKKHASSVGAYFRLAIPSPGSSRRAAGFSTRSRFLVLVNL
jgi:hypothetical protein